MASRKIIITPKAEEDLREIFGYLSEFSLHAADVQIGRILERIDLLVTFPRLGKMVDRFKNPKLRELVVGNYRIAYYIVSDEKIDILSIHHSSKHPDFQLPEDKE